MQEKCYLLYFKFSRKNNYGKMNEGVIGVAYIGSREISEVGFAHKFYRESGKLFLRTGIVNILLETRKAAYRDRDLG